MKKYSELLEYINTLEIIDTHEHLPVEAKRDAKADVLSELLTHYFSSDLLSAGMSDADMAEVRNASVDIVKRWEKVEPWWAFARNTGYGRAVEIAVRDIYGIKEINAKSILELNEKFIKAREEGGHYKRVLKDMSKILLAIRHTAPMEEEKDATDPFVYAFSIAPLFWINHQLSIRNWAEKVDKKVHTLADWLEVVEVILDKSFVSGGRMVAIKIGEAYTRSIYFPKVTYAEAETDFNEIYHTDHSADWRPPVYTGKAYQNYFVHFICRYADKRGLPIQVHTGIQEGNGNYICDSNPTHLTNLFLEYRNVKFDLFHMSYPYCMEAGNLAKNFRNVNIDMCWGHIISPEAARRALVEWLDAVPANKISAFGGDYCFVDGVYGHQYIARRNVAASLAVKVEDGSFDMDRAKEIAKMLFVENPVRIFDLESYLKK